MMYQYVCCVNKIGVNSVAVALIEAFITDPFSTANVT